VRKVAVIDFDCHHGNGTEHALAGLESVLTASIHGSGSNYPRSGLKRRDAHDDVRRGGALNIPVQPRLDEHLFLKIFRDKLLAGVRTFAPDLIIIAAGFDAHNDDPLGNLKLSDFVRARARARDAPPPAARDRRARRSRSPRATRGRAQPPGLLRADRAGDGARQRVLSRPRRERARGRLPEGGPRLVLRDARASARRRSGGRDETRCVWHAAPE
jgi:hypothetical protein